MLDETSHEGQWQELSGSIPMVQVAMPIAVRSSIKRGSGDRRYRNIAKIQGIIVHDCWVVPYFPYEGVENVLHAICLAHLLRELNFIEESTGHKWAIDLKKLSKKAIEDVSKSPERVLEDKKYTKLQTYVSVYLIPGIGRACRHFQSRMAREDGQSRLMNRIYGNDL